MNIARLAIAGVVLFCAAQLVPYGRAPTNPPKRAEPEWNSPDTRTLFFRVCRDCHSNETSWPWYSFVAPMSWLVQRDVDEARTRFNVSEWGQGKQHGDEAADKLCDGEMPLWYYSPRHSELHSRPRSLERFITGLEATFGGPADENGHGDHTRSAAARPRG